MHLLGPGPQVAGLVSRWGLFCQLGNDRTKTKEKNSCILYISVDFLNVYPILLTVLQNFSSEMLAFGVSFWLFKVKCLELEINVWASDK